METDTVITGIYGQHAENTLEQLRDVASRAEYATILPDGHLGYIMPVGGVAAYDNAVSVAGVGFDIACGNAAIRTDIKGADLLTTRLLPLLADEIASVVSFGVGRTNKADDAPTDDPLFDDPAWEAFPKGANAHNIKGKARAQLGTVGSGNHYVDVFVDEDDAVWVGVHFGSRGFGHGIASGFMALARGDDWGKAGKEIEAILPLDTEMGRGYWALMSLAGQYAYVGREWVARKIVQILGGREQELVHNHHNFAWKESHFGRELVVVRKGATPAFPGQRGFVGGSMGDISVILKGAPATLAAEERLYSTVHGAGRVMSRTEAAGKRKWGTSEILKPGKVSPEMMQAWITQAGVILRGGGLDESPHAYRRLPEVLAACDGTIEIEHTLTPLIVVMAGANEWDPYKD